jgi:hypothetical protein
VVVDSDEIVVDGRLIYFFLFLSLSLLTGNVHYYSLCFLLFNFSPHSINFLFCSFFIYRTFYSFQISPSITISHMFNFSFRSLFFKISNLSLTLLLKFFFLSISSSNQNFCFFIFFQFDPLIGNIYPSN